MEYRRFIAYPLLYDLKNKIYDKAMKTQTILFLLFMMNFSFAMEGVEVLTPIPGPQDFIIAAKENKENAIALLQKTELEIANSMISLMRNRIHDMYHQLLLKVEQETPADKKQSAKLALLLILQHEVALYLSMKIEYFVAEHLNLNDNYYLYGHYMAERILSGFFESAAELSKCVNAYSSVNHNSEARFGVKKKMKNLFGIKVRPRSDIASFDHLIKHVALVKTQEFYLEFVQSPEKSSQVLDNAWRQWQSVQNINVWNCFQGKKSDFFKIFNQIRKSPRCVLFEPFMILWASFFVSTHPSLQELTYLAIYRVGTDYPKFENVRKQIMYNKTFATALSSFFDEKTDVTAMEF